MLKGIKSISMNFNSMLNGKLVVYMSAQILQNGSANISVTVQNREVYEANKTECRTDIEEFNKLVYAAEDERVTDSEKTGGTENETEK